MENIFYIILKLIFIIFFPPLMIGIINRVKTSWAGKFGQSIFQPFYDILKLLKKEVVRSNSSSFISTIVIPMQVISILFVLFMLPFGKIPAFVSFKGDFFLFLALLGLSTICQVLIAMESAGSFEGMGASREINFSIFVEPALMLLFVSLVFYTKQFSLNNILFEFSFSSIEKSMVGILIGASFFIIILIEGKRIPIDDPTTHLELTMIHEAMILDLSSKDLAFSIYFSYLKIFAFSTITANIFIPSYLSPMISIILFILIIFIISVLIGLIESLFPRVRMSHVPDFMLLVLSVSVMIIAIIFTMNI